MRNTSLLALPRDHPESYHSFMFNNFFRHIDIDPKNVHILDGNAENLEAECESFEKKISDAGGIELFFGGIEYIRFLSLVYIKIIIKYLHSLLFRDWS